MIPFTRNEPHLGVVRGVLETQRYTLTNYSPQRRHHAKLHSPSPHNARRTIPGHFLQQRPGQQPLVISGAGSTNRSDNWFPPYTRRPRCSGLGEKTSAGHSFYRLVNCKWLCPGYNTRLRSFCMSILKVAVLV